MRAFLPGIILLQLLMVALVLLGVSVSQDTQFLVVLIAMGLIIAVLTAFWFVSIARNLFNDELTQVLKRHAREREELLERVEKDKAFIYDEKSRLQHQHARDREQLLLEAEREKMQLVEEHYQKMDKALRKASRAANLKVGVAFTLAVVAGGVMIVSQLVTVGMMVLVASGSGLTGYIVRARHERLAKKRQLALEFDKTETKRLSKPEA